MFIIPQSIVLLHLSIYHLLCHYQLTTFQPFLRIQLLVLNQHNIQPSNTPSVTFRHLHLHFENRLQVEIETSPILTFRKQMSQYDFNVLTQHIDDYCIYGFIPPSLTYNP